MIKTTKDNIILLSIVILASIIISLITRSVTLSVGGDNFTAITIFWSTLILCLIAYLISHSLAENLFMMFIKKKVKSEPMTQISQPLPTLPPQEQVHNNKETKDDIILAKKINTARRYTKKVFSPYLSDEDLEKLHENIKEYSSGDFCNSLHSVNPKELATIDIYHYGWNIWNHFGSTEQIEMARFLKQTFAHHLKDVEDPDTIRKKLRYQDQPSTISLQNKL